MKSPVIEELSYCCSEQTEVEMKSENPANWGEAEMVALSRHLLHYFLELNTYV